jgi:hypothetical protein
MKNLYSTLLMAVIFVSCNGGGGGGGGSTVTAASHLGVWSSCENYDGDGDTVNDSSNLSLLSIGESSTSFQATNYSSTGCSAGQEEYKVSSSSSYTRAGNNYSLILKEETYVSLSAGDVSWNNTNSWCGKTNWVINVPQSSLGLNCDGITSNYGDTDSATAVRSGDTLSDGDTTYQLAVGTDFTPMGQTIANGSYTFSNGVSFALFAVFNSGNYTVYRYDLENKLYNTETGTYTSSNNVVNFSVTSSNPVGCNTGSASRRFAIGSLALTMEFVAEGLILIAPKVSYSEAQFRSAFLGGGFSLGCF